ncbi:MAG: hypothetical protein K8S18_19620, partial [Desulfobacula sp.]|nr:hypothetical protein [Desulfobacula sp.]
MKHLFRIIIVMMTLSLLIPSSLFAASLLKWNTVEGDVTGYKIYYGTSIGNYPFVKDVGNTNQYSISAFELIDGTTYYFVVRAYNLITESSNSNYVEFYNPEVNDTTPPLSPEGITLQATGTEIYLKWQAAEAADLAGYRIYLGESTRDYHTSYPVDKVTSYVIKGLEAKKTYYLAMTSFDLANNESGFSPELQVVMDTDKLIITNLNPSDYELDTLTIGKTAWIDRGYKLTNIPEIYSGLTFIRTAIRDSRNTSAGFLNFSSNNSVNIYVCFSASAISIPAWLSSEFINTGDKIEHIYGTLNVWEKNFSAGTIALGGNEVGGYSYIVACEASTKTEIDKELPIVLITSPTKEDSLTTEKSSIDVSGTASDNKGVTRVSWSNSRGGSGEATGTTTWSVSGINLGEGSNIITVAAVDEAGNKSQDTFTVVYTISDTTAPTIVIESPVYGMSNETENSSIDVSGTASDNKGVTQVSWSNSRGGSGEATGTTT